MTESDPSIVRKSPSRVAEKIKSLPQTRIERGHLRVIDADGGLSLGGEGIVLRGEGIVILHLRVVRRAGLRGHRVNGDLVIGEFHGGGADLLLGNVYAVF